MHPIQESVMINPRKYLHPRKYLPDFNPSISGTDAQEISTNAPGGDTPSGVVDPHAELKAQYEEDCKHSATPWQWREGQENPIPESDMRKAADEALSWEMCEDENKRLKAQVSQLEGRIRIMDAQIKELMRARK